MASHAIVKKIFYFIFRTILKGNDSMQQAFKRAKTQIGKLVDDMTKVMTRREEEYAEIKAHQESILQINTIHH